MKYILAILTGLLGVVVAVLVAALALCAAPFVLLYMIGDAILNPPQSPVKPIVR